MTGFIKEINMITYSKESLTAVFDTGREFIMDYCDENPGSLEPENWVSIAYNLLRIMGGSSVTLSRNDTNQTYNR